MGRYNSVNGQIASIDCKVDVPIATLCFEAVGCNHQAIGFFYINIAAGPVISLEGGNRRIDIC